MVIVEQLYKMGHSTRRSLYHAVLILIISIENHILCESSSQEDGAELLEPFFNVLPYMRNDIPRGKLTNTLPGSSVNGATRPMWPQRPLKPTQIQEPPILFNPQLPQYGLLATQPTIFSENSHINTQSNLPVVFPQDIQYNPQNFITNQPKANRKLALVEPSQKVSTNDDLNLPSNRIGITQVFNYPLNNGINPSSLQPSEPSYLFGVPSEYLNRAPSSDLPGFFTGPNPSVPITQNPFFIATPDNNAILPASFPRPIPFAPIPYPPLTTTNLNSPSSNIIETDIEVTNIVQNECQPEAPQIITIQDDFDQGNEIRVPYNLEIYIPIMTSLVPTTDSGPVIDYPPYPIPPPPPIIIQARLLGGRNCGCGNCGCCGGCGYTQTPRTIPRSDNDGLTINIITDE